jgi:prephenate dehydrogenase
MDQWDSVRYTSLTKRIRTHWGIYNDMFAEEAAASVQERERIHAEMRNIQDDLCRDFKELVRLYERILGVSLPDHYQLYEICKD